MRPVQHTVSPSLLIETLGDLEVAMKFKEWMIPWIVFLLMLPFLIKAIGESHGF